jgi:SAM-dependent methyltransferase
MAPVLQDDVFTSFEGDRWFARNRTALNEFNAAADLPLKLMDLYDLCPERVAEIGAANGFRLAAIRARTGAAVVAVEPSAEAVRAGKRSFPSVGFVRGTATSVPLRGSFDLVIVNFVFHWIDRAGLLAAVAEVDRLVREEGYLLIGDFQPSNLLRVRYHHLSGDQLFTYKQNYAATFLASGLYHPVALLTGHHASKKLDPAAAEQERIGTWLLRKAPRIHYVRTENHDEA